MSSCRQATRCIHVPEIPDESHAPRLAGQGLVLTRSVRVPDSHGTTRHGPSRAHARTATLAHAGLPFLVQSGLHPMHDDGPREPGPSKPRGYRIERLIGMGSAAAVYEARRLGPANGQGEPMDRVACKVMHAERRDAPGYRARVWDEAVLGLRHTAGHPNLVEVLDFFDDARERLCIVMELVDGASAADLREPEQRLPFPIARRIGVEVLQALAHLHGRNVLYRDLSLRNILVTAAGAVKVTDFGIARVMEQGHVHTSEIRGTPVYLSAEALDLRPLDARSDLFSLGAVLYDLVTGRPPCGNQEMRGAIFARNMLGMFEPLPPDTPEDLAELITGLLQIDRDARRPQTAAEALALLRGHDQPVASLGELAALIGAAQARRDKELADHRPANVLPAGYVLAPRDGRAEGEPGALPERVAASEVDVLPAREAANVAAALSAGGVGFQANPLPDLVTYFGAQRLARIIDDLPDHPPPDLVIELEPEGALDHVTDRAPTGELDAVPEHIDDVLPDAPADRAPALVPEPAAEASTDRASGGTSGGALHRRSRPGARVAARRVLAVAIVACALVLGFLLGGRYRRDSDDRVENPEPREVAAPSVVPRPAPPVASSPATPEQPQVPAQKDETAAHLATSGPAGPRGKRVNEERETRRRAPAPTLRRPEPLGSETPSWSRP
jgi:hypothetical protein